MSDDLEMSEGGIVLPRQKQAEPPAEAARQTYPVLKGWCCNKTGERYQKYADTEFRKRALEDLYTAAEPRGGVGLPGDRPNRATELLNELSTILLGGVPEEFEEYC